MTDINTTYKSIYPPAVADYHPAPNNISSPSVARSTALSASGSQPGQTLGQANDQLTSLNNDLVSLYGKAQKDFLNPSTFAADASQMAKDINSIADIEKQIGANLGDLTGNDAAYEKGFLGDVNTTAMDAYGGLLYSDHPDNPRSGQTSYVAGSINLPLAAAASSATAALLQVGHNVGAAGNVVF